MNEENMNPVFNADGSSAYPAMQANMSNATFVPQAENVPQEADLDATVAANHYAPQTANSYAPPVQPPINPTFAPQGANVPQGNGGYAPPVPQQPVQQGYRPNGYHPPVAPPPAPQPAPKPKKKGKKVAVIIITIVAVFLFFIFAIVGAVAAFTYFIPNSKYNKAAELVEQGKYDEAISLFEEIEDFKDAEYQVDKTKELKEEALLTERINEADALYDSGDKAGAYRLLLGDKDDERVVEILDKIENSMLDEANDLIYWDEDNTSRYHWAHAHSQDDGLTTGDPFVIIYYSEKKSDPSDNSIFLAILTRETVSSYDYKSPVNATTVEFSTEKGSVEIDVTYNDRECETEGSVREEFISVKITFEEAKKIAELFADSDTVKMRLEGYSRYITFGITSDEGDGMVDIVKYITIIRTLDELKAERAAEPETDTEATNDY